MTRYLPLAATCALLISTAGCRRLRAAFDRPDAGPTTANAAPIADAAPQAVEKPETTKNEPAKDEESTVLEDSREAVYEGTLGAKPIRMRLERHGESLQGVYRYPTSRDDLTLAGTLDGDGEFTLEERTSAGVLTGRFRGAFRAKVAGTWTSAHGARSSQFSLDVVEFTRMNFGYPDTTDLGDGIRIIPQESSKTIAPFCFSRLQYPIIEGVSQTAKKRFDAHFRDLVGSSHANATSCEDAGDALTFYEEGSYTVGVRRGRWFGLFAQQCMTHGDPLRPAISHFTSCRGGRVVVSLDTGEAFDLFKKLSRDGKARLLDRCRTINMQDPHRVPFDEAASGAKNPAVCDAECKASAARLILLDEVALSKDAISVSTQSPLPAELEANASDYERSNTYYTCVVAATEAKTYFEPGLPASELFP